QSDTIEIQTFCDRRRPPLNLASANRPHPSHLTLRPRQVHTITDRFSMANTYLIDDERPVVVDPGSKLNVQLLCQYLEHFLHRSPADIDLIVLTHLHFDHTAGVEALRRVCNAPVAASSLAKRLARSRPQTSRLPSLSYLAGQVLPGTLHHLDIFPPAYEQQVKLIDLWLDDVVGLPEHPDWRVISSPGHTPESLCLYNPFTEELLCGDTVITVVGGAPLLRGSSDRVHLDQTLQTLRSLKVHYLYPGHGRPILSLHPLSNAGVEW
ncbi:MAG TPA: MBL fold metallo-hydrolase, partial [Ktedonosporobacter sp.]|nr:MBL fold metallo-hydrolase [Ktedonosporobacter sp.]